MKAKSTNSLPAQSLKVVLMLAFSAAAALAQIGSQGQLQGFVRDQSGAAVSSASVVVTDIGTGQGRTVQTDSEGYYVVANIPPALYEVSVEQSGFKRFVQTGVKLDAADRRTVDINLEVGAVAETVTVTENTAQIQTSTAQVGRVLEGQQVQNLALNGRNPIFLGMLKAGVGGGNPNGFNFLPSNGGLNVNGSRDTENSILLDGVQQVRTRAGTTAIGVINVDTVQEVQILTSNYAPEFGRAVGGQFAFVTKGGTREFHGSAYHFLRNSALDANSWGRNRTPLTEFNRVADKPPAIRFNQPGYSIGGPVYVPGRFNTNKDKLFFFFAQEWTIFREEDTQTAVVPSLAVRKGNFSEFLGVDAQGRVTGAIINPVTRQAFPGNIIPREQFSSIGRALLNAFPEPNVSFPGQRTNYITSGGNRTDTRKDTLRLDYNQGIHRVTFRGSLFAWNEENAFRGNFNLAPDVFDRPNRSASLSITSAITPTLINEFTFGAAADIVNITVGGSPARTSRGITYPYIFPGTKELEDKIPTIDIQNYTLIDGGPYPASSSGPIYTFTNALTHVRGGHTIKGGINIERSGQNDFDQINVQQVPGGTNNQNGRFEFRSTRSGGTGNAVADALLGLFSSYGEIGQKNYTPWRATAFEFFVQDNWKATQKLTLEYGVRYNYWPPWYSLWNNVATFRPEFYQPGLLGINPTNGAVVINNANFALARYNGISLPGSSFPEEARGRVAAADDASLNELFRGIPRGLSGTHKNVFEPRLGLAYAINNKTVVRTGFGIFHQRVPLNGSTLYGGNAPLQFLVGVENGSVEAPAGVISSFDDSIRFPFNLTMQDPEFKHPTAYNWSLTVQRQLPGAITVELGYVGKRSMFLTRERNINQLQPGQAFTRNAAGAPTGTVRFANALRPYLGHGPIRLSENAGNSHYHSGQLSVNRRFANGLSFDVAYTFSKSIDNASVFRELLPNAYDDRNFRGPSNFDRPHVFVVNGNLELPFGAGRRFLNDGVLSNVFGGFQVTAITFVRSGTPFSLSLPANVDLLGVGGGSSAQSLSARGPLRQIAPRFGGTFVDDPSLVTVPAPGTEGNLGRNRFRNPRFQNHDIALFRNFRITENSRIQFRAEFFNWINHPILNGPVANPVANGLTTNLTSTSFGQFAPLTDQDRASGFTTPTRDFGVYNTKGDQRRTIQFALKFLF